MSPTTANSSARLPSAARITAGGVARLVKAASSFWFVTSRAWVIQPSPYCPASVALFGPAAATKIGGG